jgi:ubiquinone/menaquinone biosynthesis C-methylase UbiE
MQTVDASKCHAMAEPVFQFTTSAVPRAYDDFLVPRLFAPWAELLLDAVGAREGDAVLDVATGPGTVARAAARRAGPRGRVVATDVSASMLAVARSKPPVAGGAPIEYVESSAESLAELGAARGGAFDVVLCQQGLQFFPDRGGALRAMHAALRPGGRLGVAVWGAVEENPVFAAMCDALRDAGAPALAELSVAPFRGPGPRDLAALAADAGFRVVRARWRELPLTFEGGAAQARASFGGTPLGPHLAALPAATQQHVAAALSRRLAPLATADGAVTAPTRSLVLTATA